MAQQRGGGGSDNDLETWLIIGVIVLLSALWILNQYFWYLTSVWKFFRTGELWLLNTITPEFIQKALGLNFKFGYEFVSTIDPKDITSEIITRFDNIYVKYINAVPSALLAWVGFRLYMRSENISTVYNMDTLMAKMSGAFPNLNQFMGKHPELTSIDFYPDDPETYEYSLAMTERQFASVVPPLGLEQEAKKDRSLRRPIWDGKNGFDEDLCRRSFDKQVGYIYRGYNYMTAEEKKLFELFRNKLLVRRKEVMPVITNYVDQITRDRVNNKYFSVDPKANKKIKINDLPKPKLRYLSSESSHKALCEKLTGIIDKKLQQHGAKFRLKEIDIRAMAASSELKSTLKAVLADSVMSKHAFTRTGLMSLIQAAREGATLAPSTFRWLKGKDRSLWYALNSVGKKVSFTESSGAFAHWLLELEAKIPVPHAEVTEAIEALKLALDISQKNNGNEDSNLWL